jgi:LysR family nod box-dependent transcriptional activator
LLVALDAVLRHSTLTSAAQSINISQPAMSISLKRLRETFGDELVRYDRGRTVYSSLAEEMRPRVAEVLERSWDLIELARRFDPQSFRGTITLCAPQSTLGFVCAPLIAALAISAPALSIRAIAYPVAPDTADRIDLFLLPRWLASPKFPCRPLFVEEFSCLVPPDYPLSQQMDEDTYLSHCHVALPPGEEELFWPEHSPARVLLAKREVRTRASQIEALRFLVVRNELIATVPSRLAQQNSAMSSARPMNAPQALSTVVLVGQASHHRAGEPVLRWLMDELTRLAVVLNPPELAPHLHA